MSDWKYLLSDEDGSPYARRWPEWEDLSNTEFSAFDPSLVDLFVSGDSLPGPWFPGLYGFKDSRGDWLYIGQSANDVPNRLRVHQRKPWCTEEVTSWVLPWADESSRLRAEAVLQLRYSPKHCKAISLWLHPDGNLSVFNRRSK